MNKYRYTATDKDGKKIRGNFVAENETEMKEMLLKAGYYVTSYRQVTSIDLSAFFSFSSKIRVSELSQFCKQFSVMISAGISIVDAVNVAAEQNFSAKLRNTLKKIKEDLKQGVLLSDSMAKYPKVFPQFFSSMVYIGETAGCLDRVLVSVAEYYELEEKTKKKIAGSLAYPIILFVMLIVIVGAMFGFVIPRFISAFETSGFEMPALTMAIFNMSSFFVNYWLYILSFLAAFIIILWALKFVPSVREFYDMLKVKLPVLRKINMAVFTSRFCRSLGLLLSSGADTLLALETLRKTITNKYLLKQFDRVINDVRMGLSLSAAIGAEMKLSPVLIQMIVIGEKTGELDQMLISTAPFFDSQSENALNLITTLIQPTVMVLLGVAIGVLFLAIYSPILSVIKSVSATA